MREFMSNHAVANAMLMLDYNEIEVELIPFAEGSSQPIPRISDAEVRVALQPLGAREVFQPGEGAIRNSFDQFLDGLERFGPLVRSGLILPRDLAPYLSYYLDIIGNPQNPRMLPPIRETLWRYVEYYGYRGAQMLFQEFGYNIRPPEASVKRNGPAVEGGR